MAASQSDPWFVIGEQVEEIARKAAREEVSSLCGLVLRRLQDVGPPQEPVNVGDLLSIFGEALSDFSGHTKEEA